VEIFRLYRASQDIPKEKLSSLRFFKNWILSIYSDEQHHQNNKYSKWFQNNRNDQTSRFFWDDNLFDLSFREDQNLDLDSESNLGNNLMEDQKDYKEP
jgi:hypothetical protein